MAKAEITINVASVKVMRSFDYCHFEVCLSTTLEDKPWIQGEPKPGVDTVDELRKMAARLADKAVEQYKIAKRAAGRCVALPENISAIRRIEPGDRTVKQQAELKAHDDAAFRSRYDYQDDWDEEDCDAANY